VSGVVFDTGAGATTRAALAAVVRHALPTVVESTLIPTALFYVAWMTLGHWPAYVVALGWTALAVLRRLRAGVRVPGILVLALIGLTLRTALALSTGSSFLYFAQPILGTCVIAALFVASCVARRPFVARIAGDFYPMTPEVAASRGLQRLFHHLTLLWAGVQLLNAAAGASMLLTMPTSVYIPTKTAVALLITAGGVYLTVMSSLRVARREGLVAVATA
jgi:hypothetical protein